MSSYSINSRMVSISATMETLKERVLASNTKENIVIAKHHKVGEYSLSFIRESIIFIVMYRLASKCMYMNS